MAILNWNKYYILNSDNYDRVSSNLCHNLGYLEDHIEIPPLPYFIKICITYLTQVAENNLYLGHSFISPREGSIYERLISDELQEKIDSIGWRERFKAMEEKLDKLDSMFK